MYKRVLLIITSLALIVSTGIFSACAGGAAGPGGDPIVLGAPVSMGYAVGADGVKFAQLAIDEINAKGGVSVAGTKRPLKLEVIDIAAMKPQTSVADALVGMEKLILEKKPVALAMSPERSEITLASMDLVAKYKLPMMIPSAKSPAILQKVVDNYATYKYNFRLTVDSLILAAAESDPIIAIGAANGWNKIFFVQEDAAWAAGTKAAVEAATKAKGWTTVGSETAPLGTTDYSMVIQKIKASGAQLVNINFSNPEGGAFIEQAFTNQVPALLMGMSSPTISPDSWKTYNGKVEYACLAVAEAGNVPVPTVPKSVTAYDAFVKKYGTGPGTDSVPSAAYDSVYVLAAAIERAGKLDGDSLVTALEATDMDGAIGHIKFDKKHQTIYGPDPKTQAVSVMTQWQKPGNRTIIAPTAAASGQVQLPPWIKK
jgi:branched-chain amino acid transport system substrate-binding protein